MKVGSGQNTTKFKAALIAMTKDNPDNNKYDDGAITATT